MQLNITQLARKAVLAALGLDWPEAIKVNIEILAKDPNNLEAKLRLGRAYLHTNELQKAKKMFKEVLMIDPINQVALRNLALLKENNIVLSTETGINTDALIKEPGTSVEEHLLITAKSVKAEALTPGEQFKSKLKKSGIEIIDVSGKKEMVLGELQNPELAAKLLSITKQGGTYSISFIKGKDKKATLLVKCSKPVFKSDKQDIRPYIKKGSLDEPDLEGEEIELPIE